MSDQWFALRDHFPGSEYGALVVIIDVVLDHRGHEYEWALTVRPVHPDGHIGDERPLRIRANPIASSPVADSEPVVISWHQIIVDAEVE